MPNQCQTEGVALQQLAVPALHHHHVDSPQQMMDFFDQQVFSIFFTIFGVIILFLYAVSTFFVYLSFIGGHFHLHKKTSAELLQGGEVPGVSIVKPLMGIDPLLEVNLESHFKLRYPKFELLFCCHNDQDPAISLVQQMMKRFPKVDVRIFCRGREEIMNPMVQNMVQGYEAAKYEYVWIISSRVKVSTDVIYDMAAKLQPSNVALVHQMPFFIQSTGLANAVEKIYFGCAFARYYIAFSFLGMCCVTGMSYMFKKSILDQLNGLGWYGQYLAEDYFLTKAMHEKGYKLVLSTFPAQQNITSTSVQSFIDRMVRWLRLRINMMPVVAIFLEPLTECLTLGVLMAVTVHYFFGINPLAFFAGHVVSWVIRDYFHLIQVQNEPLNIGKFRFLYVWLLRECLPVLVFLKAMYNLHHIKWGKHAYYVRCGGHTEVEDNSGLSSDL